MIEILAHELLHALQEEKADVQFDHPGEYIDQKTREYAKNVDYYMQSSKSELIYARQLMEAEAYTFGRAVAGRYFKKVVGQKLNKIMRLFGAE